MHHLEAKRGSSDGNDDNRDHSYSDCGDDEQHDSSSGDHGDSEIAAKLKRRTRRQTLVR